MPTEMLTTQMLRDRAGAYRQEAAALGLLLPYLTVESARETRLRIVRFQSLASDLERAAQQKEALGV